MDDASPAKWHLAHTTWFFETFLLEDALPGYRPFDPAYRVLFNSYYHSVGEQYPRPRRGLLSRPTLEQVLEYRSYVDKRVLGLMEAPGGLSDPLAEVVELGLHHEQQHQELILTDVKHLLSCNPLRPAYQEAPPPTPVRVSPVGWHRYEGGLCWIGSDGPGFSFDNEGPRHRVFLEAFELASRPVTNGEFLAFMEDGGYERPDHWLSDGWAAVQKHGWRAPFYWEQRDGGWWLMTLSGLREVHAEEPVCHVSLYEADAFARWAGARLPSEAEWELAAAEAPIEGGFADDGLLHPAPAHASGRTNGPVQLFGDVWEWTQSPYGPYPGYRPPPGAFGEYNGKFMSNQLVLRGGSCATPRSHIRATYRNFFFPDTRWQFSGLRLARDAR
jgi:ergothioneine biosynthesis protein EgtB